MHVENLQDIKLKRFGFDFECGGVHTARTMMLAELQTLLEFADQAGASKGDYLEAVQESNCLSKRSGKSRVLTFRHLAALYTLDSELMVFRVLLYFWHRDVAGQPLLAALCAYTRDPIFRATAPYILGFEEGATITRQALEEYIDTLAPGRFSEATLKSTAQNVNSSWTQTGHLSGRVRKMRAKAVATPGAVAMALLLGYVGGIRGQALFTSEFIRLLDCSFEKAIELAEDASRRGWISLKRAGNIVEVLFPKLITVQELEWLREQS